MNKLQFRCKLLSDVILSQKAATESSHETLDFIPGGVFLGIVAASYDKYTQAEQTVLFHSGKVRFGDAHPVIYQGEQRSLRIPAALYYPKLLGLSASFYLSYFHDRKKEEQGKPLQLKQCRQGFYLFDNDSMTEVATTKSYAIKSAYNRDLRRSDDSKMYGYESLEKNTEFLFSVECDDPYMAKQITEALLGVKHIGRSRTAQYGLVEIIPCEYKEVKSTTDTFMLDGDKCITVYADGRLIFLDASGEATFIPSASDLGLDGEIIWEKSQLRTFQYAPWNGKRQTRDSDRVGFEKGSVFVVHLKDGKLPSTLPTYVGSYKNEGFGKIIYGWNLLQKVGDNGLKALSIMKATRPTDARKVVSVHTPLLSYLGRMQKEKMAASYIYKEVNGFVKQYGRIFPKDKFSSQWGAIRNIATQYDSYDKIVEVLFEKVQAEYREPSPTDPRTKVTTPAAFLTHGVAAAKWKECGRINILRSFVDKMKFTEYGDLSQKALINLSSQMAKNEKIK